MTSGNGREGFYTLRCSIFFLFVFFYVNDDLCCFAVKGKKQHKGSEQQQVRVERCEGLTLKPSLRCAKLWSSFKMESAYLCTPAALRDAEYRQSAFGALG